LPRQDFGAAVERVSFSRVITSRCAGCVRVVAGGYTAVVPETDVNGHFTVCLEIDAARTPATV
jgi:hypothetical protein